MHVMAHPSSLITSRPVTSDLHCSYPQSANEEQTLITHYYFIAVFGCARRVDLCICDIVMPLPKDLLYFSRGPVVS